MLNFAVSIFAAFVGDFLQPGFQNISAVFRQQGWGGVGRIQFQISRLLSAW